MGIVSIIMGIMVIMISNSGMSALILAIVGIVFGIIGILEMKDDTTGKIVPGAGLVLCTLMLVIIMINVFSGKVDLLLPGSTNNVTKSSNTPTLDAFDSTSKQIDNTIYGK